MILKRINRVFTLSFMIIYSLLSHSQVGINTESPKATLDVNAGFKDGRTAEGIIPPRLTGEQIKLADSKFGEDQIGAMVYATSPVSTPSDKTKNITVSGYYFFDGTLWQILKSQPAWLLTGNSDISSTNNIIGSLNTGGHILFKAANKYAGLLMDDATNQKYNVAFGPNALNLKSGNYLSTYYNTALGSNALASNEGNNNTAVGTDAAKALVSGNYNTIVGRAAFNRATAGSQNVGIGYLALSQSTTGSYNTSVGAQSGENITTGSYNIVIGYKQNVASPTANYQLNIGGAIFGTDLIVGTPSAPRGNIGIGTSTPGARLEVDSGTSNVSGFKFTRLNSATPVKDGQALGVDSNGNVITISNPKTTLGQTVESQIGSSGGAVSQTFNIDGTNWTDIPQSSNTITVPSDGKVLFINFMLGLEYDTIDENSHYTVKLFVDGAETNVFQTAKGSISQSQFSLSTVKFLAAGNHTISVKMKKTLDSGDNVSMACGIMSMSFNISYIN